MSVYGLRPRLFGQLGLTVSMSDPDCLRGGLCSAVGRLLNFVPTIQVQNGVPRRPSLPLPTAADASPPPQAAPVPYDDLQREFVYCSVLVAALLLAAALWVIGGKDAMLEQEAHLLAAGMGPAVSGVGDVKELVATGKAAGRQRAAAKRQEDERSTEPVDKVEEEVEGEQEEGQHNRSGPGMPPPGGRQEHGLV